MKFRNATLSDIPLLQLWDRQPHVIASNPNDVWDWETELSSSPSWRELLIAEKDHTPIGVVQIIDPEYEESHYWGEIGSNLRAIDIWIGDIENTGKGLGTKIMRLAIRRCFSDSSVKGILVDPLQSNTGARKFYRKLGFQFLEDRKFGEDLCAVYILRRSFD